MYAPVHHPAMKVVAPVRGKWACALFNILGPLHQPGERAGHPDGRVPPRPGRHPGARAAELGAQRALVVWGRDGMDRAFARGRNAGRRTARRRGAQANCARRISASRWRTAAICASPIRPNRRKCCCRRWRTASEGLPRGNRITTPAQRCTRPARSTASAGIARARAGYRQRHARLDGRSTADNRQRPPREPRSPTSPSRRTTAVVFLNAAKRRCRRLCPPRPSAMLEQPRASHYLGAESARRLRVPAASPSRTGATGRDPCLGERRPSTRPGPVAARTAGTNPSGIAGGRGRTRSWLRRAGADPARAERVLRCPSGHSEWKRGMCPSKVAEGGQRADRNPSAGP